MLPAGAYHEHTDMQVELDVGGRLIDRNGAPSDAGVDPEALASDLLAACKANDTKRAQDLVADGVSPGFSDPESGPR